jgi:hypothetical protein
MVPQLPPNLPTNMTTQEQYKDDPEEYFQIKKDREEQKTQDFHDYWNRWHPNEVPGANTFSYLPKE